MPGSLLAAAPLPLTDNVAPPYIGVWEPMYQGTGATDAFAKWLGRQGLFPVVTQYVFDDAGWPAKPDKYWVDPVWAKWVAAAPGRRAVVFLPFKTDSESLKKGASGGFNEKAIEEAQYLVANKLGNSIICMGLINAPNDWGSASADDAANFVKYWQQFVTAMRTVPGAVGLRFDWVGMNRKSSFPIEAAYPGDGYVDMVGMILYDQCTDTSIYPIPASATDDERLACQKKAWDLYYYPAARNGLEAWMKVAKSHGKPFSIPLWCLYSDHYSDGTLSTGGDNTYFIQQMFNLIEEPANNVYFADYMDIYYDCTKLMSNKEYQTIYPKSAELFQKLFGLPTTTQPTK